MITYDQYEFDIEFTKQYKKENGHRNYMQEILWTMSNSDITEMVIDKKKELKRLEERIYLDSQLGEWIRNSVIWDLYKKLLWKLDYEIRCRDPESNAKNTKEDLDRKKQQVSITNIISTITWKPINNPKINYKCFLPTHNDKTGSFHIYEQSWTFKCFGCWKWWTWIDFIQQYNQCSLGEAIRIFLTFN